MPPVSNLVDDIRDLTLVLVLSGDIEKNPGPLKYVKT